MSMFKDRSGGSMFRFKSLSGYQKLLYEEHFMKDNQQPEHPIWELQNKMTAEYQIE